MVTERKRKVPIRLLYRFGWTTPGGIRSKLKRENFICHSFHRIRATGYYMRKRESQLAEEGSTSSDKSLSGVILIRAAFGNSD